MGDIGKTVVPRRVYEPEPEDEPHHEEVPEVPDREPELAPA